MASRPITREPLEIEYLLSADARRTSEDHSITDIDELVRDKLDRPRMTINQHAAFRQSLTTPTRLDDIDELVSEIH